MELELKHLAAYLPYSVATDTGILTCSIIDRREKNNTLQSIRMHLRPLSDLKKEIEVNGEKFVPIEKIKSDYFIGIEGVVGEDLRVYCFLRDTTLTKSIWDMPYEVIVQLTEWHFDIFNLIPNGLAIDINTLNNQS